MTSWTQITDTRWSYDEYQLYITKAVDRDSYEVMLHFHTHGSRSTVKVKDTGTLDGAVTKAKRLMDGELSDPYQATEDGVYERYLGY